MYGKVVQIKLFLAMHITNKKIGFDIYIYTVGNLLNIFMEHECLIELYKR